MKKFEYSEADQKQIGEAALAVEYPLEEEGFSITQVTITSRRLTEDTDRYPEEGKRAVNKKCRELVYIFSATPESGVVIDGREFGPAKGDVVMIEPGEEFFWRGYLDMLMFCVPAWTPEQHEIVE
ncbi:MAG: hypothetical protein V5A57_01460 [Candidatus Paceibacterota bacterium]